MSAPFLARYNAETHTFEVLPRFRAAADRSYCDELVYSMDAIDEMQSKQDRYFHVTLRDLWKNLPEGTLEEALGYDDFRAWCLIKCQFYHEDKFPMASNRAAISVLGILNQSKEFSITEVHGSVITRWRAKSQKLRGGMPAEERKASYKAVLEFAADLVKTTVDAARRNAEEAA